MLIELFYLFSAVALFLAALLAAAGVVRVVFALICKTWVEYE